MDKTDFLPINIMLVLTKGQTTEYLYVTLNERRTLDDGWYLWVFENITTRATITMITAFAEDLSDYPDRINKFSINTSSVFASADHGTWTYRIYEQSSSSNTDTTGLTEIERGLLKLNAATAFSFTEYSETSTFKQYGG